MGSALGTLLLVLVAIYIMVMIGCTIAYLFTNFIPPKGLWRLVPFRIGGWRSYLCPHRIYKNKWVWEGLYSYYEEKKKGG